MLKAVILMGGPQKGTRFRPISLDCPKPLFPMAGLPMVEHLIKECSTVDGMKEIFLIGFYPQQTFTHFIDEMIRKYNISVRYLQEYQPLGTAGGIYHFRDQIRIGDPEAVFLINGDVCGDFDLKEMLDFHRRLPNDKLITIMATEATRQQCFNYGCIVENKDNHQVLHYVEKPQTYISSTISCGVYLFQIDLFYRIGDVFKRRHEEQSAISYNDSDDMPNHNGVNGIFGGDNISESISLEEDLLMPLSQTKSVFVFKICQQWWSQLKTGGSAIYANRNYLKDYRKTNAQILASNSVNGPKIVGDVYIHPTANIDATATIGPNVSISEGVKIGAGVRVKESIILKNAIINDHALVLHSIVGCNCTIGLWSRVEGTPCDPNPNKAFAKIDNQTLFDGDGKLNPLISVLGSNVQICSEIIVLNSIVLPFKELNRSYKNEIIL
ncbi:mannose-1-phosphate guanyltransferase alpha-B-like [Oppia nitens]|uniref:mannose-1-phosphate guanyltransferase alpha-B-like n=1 Tax=Oppia nitens TaxID=1686743 RepID=UPI0023DA9EB7|nr:mannose-1-phosphate guanyltransferase alpha-B-like [Oppia nitens]